MIVFSTFLFWEIQLFQNSNDFYEITRHSNICCITTFVPYRKTKLEFKFRYFTNGKYTKFQFC